MGYSSIFVLTAAVQKGIKMNNMQETIILKLDYMQGPIWISDKFTGQPLTGIEGVDNDAVLIQLNLDCSDLYDSFFEFNSADGSFTFNREKEKSSKNILLNYIKKIKARLNEINDGSFADLSRTNSSDKKINMIKKIRFLFDYQCYPIWLYDEKNRIVNTLLPDELKDDFGLDDKFSSLQTRYDNLFKNTPKEFSYIGFKNAKDREKFITDWNEAVFELKNKLGDKYEIVDDVSNNFNALFPDIK